MRFLVLFLLLGSSFAQASTCKVYQGEQLLSDRVWFTRPPVHPSKTHILSNDRYIAISTGKINKAVNRMPENERLVYFRIGFVANSFFSRMVLEGTILKDKTESPRDLVRVVGGSPLQIEFPSADIRVKCFKWD